jgi:NAD(P)-dependent dehydrogenase (short-subunit alcohol dehydrogenase family)
MTGYSASPLVIITGAGGGLAPAVAHTFLAAGYRLALVTRPGKEAGVAGLVQELEAAVPSAGADGGSTVSVFGIDLASAEAGRAGLQAVEAELGPAAALLNLAGGFAMGGPHDHGPELLEKMLNINLRTAVNSTAALLPGMLERGEGYVVAIGANAVLAPAPGMTAYAAAKGALATFQRSLAAEVGAKGVSVALLIPAGAIDTPGNRSSMPKADRSRWLDPDALAQALLFLCQTPPQGRVHELVLTPH